MPHTVGLWWPRAVGPKASLLCSTQVWVPLVMILWICTLLEGPPVFCTKFILYNYEEGRGGWVPWGLKYKMPNMHCLDNFRFSGPLVRPVRTTAQPVVADSKLRELILQTIFQVEQRAQIVCINFCKFVCWSVSVGQIIKIRSIGFISVWRQQFQGFNIAFWFASKSI